MAVEHAAAPALLAESRGTGHQSRSAPVHVDFAISDDFVAVAVSTRRQQLFRDKGVVPMGRIVISQNVTLDGVVEDPTGEGGFRHGGWFDQMTDADREQWAGVEFTEAQAASALLHGRRTDAYFGHRWNGQTNPWARRLNALPKYVVSSTLAEPVWANSTVLEGDAVDEAHRLKEQIDGEVVVYASRPWSKPSSRAAWSTRSGCSSSRSSRVRVSGCSPISATSTCCAGERCALSETAWSTRSTRS